MAEHELLDDNLEALEAAGPARNLVLLMARGWDDAQNKAVKHDV